MSRSIAAKKVHRTAESIPDFRGGISASDRFPVNLSLRRGFAPSGPARKAKPEIQPFSLGSRPDRAGRESPYLP